MYRDTLPPSESELVPDRVVYAATPELYWLKHNCEPCLFDEENKLCGYTPTNMIGGLLVYLNRQYLVEYFEKAKIWYNQDLHTPLSYQPQASLCVTEANGLDRVLQDAHGQHIQVEHVLYKRFCGALSGIVLGAPYTGLIVTPTVIVDPLTKRLATASIERLWNDSMLLDFTTQKYQWYYKPELVNPIFPEFAESVDWLGSQYISLVDQTSLASELFVQMYERARFGLSSDFGCDLPTIDHCQLARTTDSDWT